MVTATDAAAARSAIGAGTSSLAIGTTGTTAKAGNYQPAAADISDSTATGRSVVTAASAAAARTAIGAGTASTKADVGLGSVDNTADASKAVLSATKLATARTINGVSFDGTSNITLPNERTWAPEAVLASGTLATGYNDLPGGFSVEPGPNATGVLLDAIWIRLGTIGATVATTSAIFDVYAGTATTQGSLITSITLAVGDNNQIATLGTAYALAANAVVRVNCSTAGGVTTPIHCQLRGRYVG